MDPSRDVRSSQEELLWYIEETFWVGHRENFYANSGLHYHTKLEVYFITDGECEYFVDDKVYTLKAGDLVITPPMVLHKTSTILPKSVSRLLIYCDPSVFPASVREYLKTAHYRIVNVYKGLTAAKEALEKLMLEHASPDAFSEDMMKGYLTSAVVALSRHGETRQGSETKSEHPFIESAISYIKANYFKNISLDDIAKHAAVSGQYLSGRFKKETGFKLSEYLNLYRLKQAEIMIVEHPEKSIMEISLACGFNDSNYFATRFKKVYGVTPSQLRNKLK